MITTTRRGFWGMVAAILVAPLEALKPAKPLVFHPLPPPAVDLALERKILWEQIDYLMGCHIQNVRTTFGDLKVINHSLLTEADLHE